jgi:hypothetical protein
MTTDLTDPNFHDEEAARKHTDSIRWPNGSFCPQCGTANDITPGSVRIGRACTLRGPAICR